MKAPINTATTQSKTFAHKLQADHLTACTRCRRTPTIKQVSLDGALIKHTQQCGACYFGAESFFEPRVWAD